jgi:hypothetical protein
VRNGDARIRATERRREQENVDGVGGGGVGDWQGGVGGPSDGVRRLRAPSPGPASAPRGSTGPARPGVRLGYGLRLALQAPAGPVRPGQRPPCGGAEKGRRRPAAASPSHGGTRARYDRPGPVSARGQPAGVRSGRAWGFATSRERRTGPARARRVSESDGYTPDGRLVHIRSARIMSESGMPSTRRVGRTGRCGAHHADACAGAPRARVVGHARDAAAAVSREHVAASGRGIGSRECCMGVQGDGCDSSAVGRRGAELGAASDSY